MMCGEGMLKIDFWCNLVGWLRCFNVFNNGLWVEGDILLFLFFFIEIVLLVCKISNCFVIFILFVD